MKTLTLTTPTHAFAFSTYATQAMFGLFLLAGATVRSLSAFVFVPVIGFALFAAGATGLFAIIRTHRMANPEPGMRLEVVAAAGLGLTNFALMVSLVIMYGPLGAATISLTYVLGVSASCAFRVWQIQIDRRKLRAALALAQPADDATLAEPPDITK
jgi:hypothetical protein